MIPVTRRPARHALKLMPTPFGHALGGIAAGALVAGRARSGVWHGRRVPVLLVCGVLGMLPDLDILLGGHREMTHSVGATLIVGGLAAAVDRRPAVWLAAAAAYGTHLLLDWFGADPVPPFGIMALWPFDHTFYLSPYQWFPSVCRQFWLAACWIDLGRAAWWELLVLGPVALAGLLLARRRTVGTGA